MGLVTGTVSPEDLGLCRVVMGIEAAARGMSESGGMARVVPGDRIRHAGTASTNVRFGERLSEYRGRLPGLRHFRDGSRFHSG